MSSSSTNASRSSARAVPRQTRHATPYPRCDCGFNHAHAFHSGSNVSSDDAQYVRFSSAQRVTPSPEGIATTPTSRLFSPPPNPTPVHLENDGWGPADIGATPPLSPRVILAIEEGATLVSHGRRGTILELPVPPPESDDGDKQSLVPVFVPLGQHSKEDSLLITLQQQQISDLVTVKRLLIEEKVTLQVVNDRLRDRTLRDERTINGLIDQLRDYEQRLNMIRDTQMGQNRQVREEWAHHELDFQHAWRNLRRRQGQDLRQIIRELEVQMLESVEYFDKVEHEFYMPMHVTDIDLIPTDVDVVTGMMSVARDHALAVQRAREDPRDEIHQQLLADWPPA